MKDQILRLVERLFSDTSVPVEVTLEQLEEIRDQVQSNIDAIKEDIGASFR